jgi:hypothetical protein
MVTGADGTLETPRLAGGGGPYVLYAQWVVLDAAAEGGSSLSNALAITWLP